MEITLVCGYKDKYLEDSLILCVLSILMVERSPLSYMMFLPPGFGLVCGIRHEYVVALLCSGPEIQSVDDSHNTHDTIAPLDMS